MKESYILIPSATLVPQVLQNIGQLPGIIYPINQRLVFDYLYEQYSKQVAGMRVVCYEKADKIQRRLSAYKESKIDIYKLSELKDLGHTVYEGLGDLQGTVVINFADTIVFDNILDVIGDAFFYSMEEISNTWTYYQMNKGVITDIVDKENITSDSMAKVFVGVFKITDAAYFRKCLEQAFLAENIKISTFYYALCKYSEEYPLKEISTDNWFDIGHADTYYNSQLEVKAREFNHISIDRERGILKKTSEDVDKFIGEIMWYLKLPADIEYVRPRIFSYSTSYSSPYIAMEYYDYHTVHELFLYGDLTKHQWKDVFKRIQFVCSDFKRYKVSGAKVLPALEDMYLTKTIQRLELLKENECFKRFFDETVTINGKKYKSLNEITERIKFLVPNMLYDVKEFNIIHGDLCFANMLIDSNCSFIKVIDPRGKFGEFDIYGDMRYELAKLFHSLDGKYDYIIKDLFEIEYDCEQCCIDFKILDRIREYNLFELFLHIFKDEIGADTKQIELIEALLFISMIPLHGESFKHQLVMLATGLNILARVDESILK